MVERSSVEAATRRAASHLLRPGYPPRVRAPTILVCGHVTLDVVAGARVPGGSAWYAARALAALGARPRVLTAAGAELPRDALAGLEAVVVPSPATTVFENAYGRD